MCIKDYDVTRKQNGYVEVVYWGLLGLEHRIVIPPDNSEIRYITVGPDGLEGRLTVSLSSHWQKAHYHKGITEHYTIRTGFMLLAMFNSSGKFEIEPHFGTPRNPKRLTVATREPHSIFYPKGAWVSVEKEGDPESNPEEPGNHDWYAAPELDRVTKAFGPEEIELLVGKDVPKEYPIPEDIEEDLRDIIQKA